MFAIRSLTISMHLGVDKTKSVLFASKHKIKSARKQSVKYKYKNKTTFAGYISWLYFGWNFVWGTYGIKSIK